MFDYEINNLNFIPTFDFHEKMDANLPKKKKKGCYTGPFSRSYNHLIGVTVGQGDFSCSRYFASLSDIFDASLFPL